MPSQILSSSAGAGRYLGGSAPGYAGPGLGTSLLARDRARDREGAGWEEDDALGGLKLG